MNETDEYILDAIRRWVWSGYYSPGDVDTMIDDILEDDADEAKLRAAVLPEFDKKIAAEEFWPATTDCDRLDWAFDKLNSIGIVALQNAGVTMSEGLEDVFETADERGHKGIQGYCFFHGQDLDRALDGDGLTLAFGDFEDDRDKKTEVGHSVKEVLESFGFSIDWNGDPETRLKIPVIDWKRRRAE